MTNLPTYLDQSYATIVDVEFNDWLLLQIKENGYTPASFAKHAGISKQAIYNYLEGRVPDRGSLEKIAIAFRVPPEEVFKIAISGKKKTDDPWADQMAHKLNQLDDLRKGIAMNLLNSLLDQQEKDQIVKSQPQRAKP